MGGPAAPFAVGIDRAPRFGEPLVGGKAATAGGLRQAGLPIPDRFFLNALEIGKGIINADYEA